MQDEYARILAQPILDRWGLSGMPVAWYYPLALTHPEPMDTVPHPENGNTLTIRQYQQAWLDTYRQLVGGALPSRDATSPAAEDSQLSAPLSPRTCDR